MVSTGRVEPGSWGNLPSGEAFVLPRGANGRLVIDTAVGGIAPGFGEISVEVTNGRVILDNEVETPLHGLIRQYETDADDAGFNPQDVRRVCEFGLGTNPKAMPLSFIEIEKILGTAHVAIGSNVPFGGSIAAPNHNDMVLGRPEVLLDNVPILRNGRIREAALRDFTCSDVGSRPVQQVESQLIVERLEDRAREDRDALQGRWKPARGPILQAQIGPPHVARAALDIWRVFDDRPTREVAQLISALSATHTAEQVKQTLAVMERFGAVRIRHPRRGQNRIA